MRTRKADRRRAQRQKKHRCQPPWVASSLSATPNLESERTTREGGRLEQFRFYPELTLGAGALSDGRQRDIERYLVAVLRKRGSPLHLANLWNALYFNYDLSYGGFRAGFIASERIPTRTAAGRDWSLPVGGFVRVHTEAACGDLLAEVIYKEGAHTSISADWLEDPSISGAPAACSDEHDGGRVVVVRERFVLDLAAFGPDGNRVTAKQYDRLCRKALWLDENGHLVIEALYTPEQAELSDLDFYADYLLVQHRDGLLAHCFDRDLPDHDLREALLRSFEAVRAIAASSRELRSWRDRYFFCADEYERRLDGQVLGRSDLRTVHTGLTRMGRGRRVYSAIGPRILELLGRDGFDSAEEALVRGCAYATAVCDANSFVADTLAREQRDGVLADGIHLRLDDDWQAGGIWRAETVADPERYSLATLPPTVPLGLGHAEANGARGAVEELTADEQPIASSQTGFRVALTLRDRSLGRLRLSAEAANVIAPGRVDVTFAHGDERARWPDVERDGNVLYGIPWPWDLHPGVVLACNVEREGGVVKVRTVRVTPALEASDGTRFDVDTNLAVYEHELGLCQLSGAELRGTPSLRELCNRAFRLRGRQRADRRRGLTLAELATIVLGPAWRPGETRVLAQALAEMGLERDGADYLWTPRVGARTRASDSSLLSAYGEAKARGPIAQRVQRHWVRMHLRQYSEWSGKWPSEEKRQTFSEARRRNRMWHVLPEELPEGCTWVESYAWGGDAAPDDTERQPDGQQSAVSIETEPPGVGLTQSEG